MTLPAAALEAPVFCGACLATSRVCCCTPRKGDSAKRVLRKLQQILPPCQGRPGPAASHSDHCQKEMLLHVAPGAPEKGWAWGKRKTWMLALLLLASEPGSEAVGL